MNDSVFFAIFSSVFATVNDLIYRKSGVGKEVKKIFLFYFLSAFFSAVFALIAIFILKGRFAIKLNEVYYGSILGFISFFTYILFILSFNGSNTSISVTIFRLNSIPSILLALIFLGEVITPARGIGILLSIASMILFVGRTPSLNGGHIKYVYFSLGACLSCSVLNFFNKVAVKDGTDSLHLLFWRFITVMIISGIVLWVTKPGRIASKELRYPMLSGLVLLLSVLFTLRAFKTGDVSVVIPIASLSFVFVAIISWTVLKEKINMARVVGVFCAVLAIILINF